MPVKESDKPRRKKSKTKGKITSSRYKGEFIETCLAVYDSLNIEQRESQRELLETMACEMEAGYARQLRNELDEANGIEVAEDLKGFKFFIGQAPVGTGKTYVILILAFVSFWLYGKKTVVSTQTKVLQNQILKKDLPILRKLLKQVSGENGIVDAEALEKWTAHLVKGRDNYLCPYRVKYYMEKTRKGRDMVITNAEGESIRISYNQLMSINGDDSQVRTESLDLDRYSQIGDWSENLLGLISASQENCAKSVCEYFPRKCPYYNAKFMDSPLIICNHNIIKSTLRPSYMEETKENTEETPKQQTEQTAETGIDAQPEPLTSPISSADNYIFDEAHHFMGYYCGKKVQFKLDHESVYPSIFSPIFCSPWDMGTSFMKKLKKLRIKLWETWKTICRYGAELSEINEHEQELHICKILEEIGKAKTEANEIQNELVAFSQEKTLIAFEKLVNLEEMLDDLKAKIESVHRTGEETSIFSDDSYESVKYEPGCLSSDIDKVFEKAAFTGFLSGTILIEGKADVFTRECGLPNNCTVAKVDSPFNHENVMLWIPKANSEIILPNAHPVRPEAVRREYEDRRRKFFINFCCQRIPEYIKNTLGGVLILCTSVKNKKAVASALRPLVEAIPNRFLYEQGEMPRAKLVNNFLNSESCVLVGTNSFREGFDAVGEKLTWVILDKLPYANANDPDMKKRLAILSEQDNTEQGKSEEDKKTNILRHRNNLMAFDLIQSMGRLERSISDWGTITILDPRFYWLCKEGRDNPFMAFEKDFIDEARECFEQSWTSNMYEWLTRDKYKFLKAMSRNDSDADKDNSTVSSRKSWKSAACIEQELPFNWANKMNLRDNMPSLSEWIYQANELRQEAQIKKQAQKPFG